MAKQEYELPNMMKYIEQYLVANKYVWTRGPIKSIPYQKNFVKEYTIYTKQDTNPIPRFNQLYVQGGTWCQGGYAVEGLIGLYNNYQPADTQVKISDEAELRQYLDATFGNGPEKQQEIKRKQDEMIEAEKKHADEKYKAADKLTHMQTVVNERIDTIDIKSIISSMLHDIRQHNEDVLNQPQFRAYFISAFKQKIENEFDQIEHLYISTNETDYMWLAMNRLSTLFEHALV